MHRVPPSRMRLRLRVLSLLAVVAATLAAGAAGRACLASDSVTAPTIEPQDVAGRQIITGILEQTTSPKWVAPASSAQESEGATVRVAKRSARAGIRWVKPQSNRSSKSSTTKAQEKSSQAVVITDDVDLQQETPELPPVEEAPAVTADDSDSAPQAVSQPVFLQVNEPSPNLTPQQQRLKRKIRQVLKHYYNRPLSTHDRSPWELMHAALAFEVHSKVLQGGPNGKPITAVGWLCFNQPCKRRTLMLMDDAGDLRVRVGPALQGHEGQLLAILAQTRVSSDYPIEVEGQRMTIEDLIEKEQRTCYPRTELTFKLIGLSHYLPSGATWVNDQGMAWDIPRLIQEEIRQPVRGAACGGTHRLGGLTLAYKKRERRGEPVDGEYLRAKKFTKRYQNYAYRLQNPDGSLSTEWFRGPGSDTDIDRRLKTTGHLLEWLMYASTEKERAYWRTTRAANYLANLMLKNRYRDWEAGPLGHAIHALFLYDRMVFQEDLAPGSGGVATKNRASGRR